MKLCFINQALYAVLLLLAIVAAIAWIMPHKSIDLSEVDPVEVAKFNLPNFSEQVAIKEPRRNVFDKNGIAWQKSRELNKTTAGKTATAAENSGTAGNAAVDEEAMAEAEVLGLIRLGGLEGLLTRKGFVPVGRFINGGKLVSVGKSEYVLDLKGQRKVFSVDDDRERRRKRFKSLGFPFLN